jgi:nucleotide-binding universal stress UspA family protein
VHHAHVSSGGARHPRTPSPPPGDGNDDDDDDDDEEEETMSFLNHVLFATDGSDASKAAGALAARLACDWGAKLTVVHAYEIPTMSYVGAPMLPLDVAPALVRAVRGRLDEAVATVRQTVPTADGVLQHGEPCAAILEAAKELGADLIVLGTHGRRGVAHAFLGSVAEKVVRLSPVPVLTVRPAPVVEDTLAHAGG